MTFNRKAPESGENVMPLIGWIFVIGSLALIVGGIVILRDNASNFHIPKDKMQRIQQRKKEMEARDREEDR